MQRINKGTLWANRLWAIEKHALDKLLAADGPMVAQQEPSPGPGYSVTNGIATINIVGPLNKYEDIWMEVFGGVSTIAVQSALASANADSDVTSILLYIDSPGGSVSGTVDLGDAIYESAKPVTAYISDCGASAAYWLASQCDQVYMNRAGFAGSIGVYATVVDSSGLYADSGVRVNVVKAGTYKGAGADGTEITPEYLASLQTEIDAVYDLFVDAVARGRGL